jgi:hypothetical protein
MNSFRVLYDYSNLFQHHNVYLLYVTLVFGNPAVMSTSPINNQVVSKFMRQLVAEACGTPPPDRAG